MIYLVQYLCPARHCIIAAAYDSSETTYAETVKGMTQTLYDSHANLWCGICGSHALHFEQGPTKFRSIAQAMPALKECESDQMFSRAFLDALGETYEAKARQ